MKLDHWGRKWTFAQHMTGNGSKRFGFELWWNSGRVGADLYFWVWGFTVMRDWR